MPKYDHNPMGSLALCISNISTLGWKMPTALCNMQRLGYALLIQLWWKKYLNASNVLVIDNTTFGNHYRKVCYFVGAVNQTEANCQLLLKYPETYTKIPVLRHDMTVNLTGSSISPLGATKANVEFV